MFRELRAIFSKYSNEELATKIVKCLEDDGAVNILYMQSDLVDELNDLEYIQPIKKRTNISEIGGVNMSILIIIAWCLIGVAIGLLGYIYISNLN